MSGYNTLKPPDQEWFASISLTAQIKMAIKKGYIVPKWVVETQTHWLKEKEKRKKSCGLSDVLTHPK